MTECKKHVGMRKNTNVSALQPCHAAKPNAADAAVTRPRPVKRYFIKLQTKDDNSKIEIADDDSYRRVFRSTRKSDNNRPYNQHIFMMTSFYMYKHLKVY